MKFNHNKKRNTAFIFEMLVAELTKATMNESMQRKQSVLNILKEFFAKNKPLKKELDIYKSFDNLEKFDNSTAEKILTEAKKQFSNLDRKQIYQEQSKIINKINKSLGPRCWNNFVANYKKLATVNQTLSQNTSPKNQVLVEKKLLDALTTSEVKKQHFPKVNSLAMKSFVEKFNEKYSDVLCESQREFLAKYITSNDNNNLEFKAYLYEEVADMTSFLTENRNKYDETTSNKINKVLTRMKGYNEKKFDKDLVFEVLRIQSLISELKAHGN